MRKVCAILTDLVRWGVFLALAGWRLLGGNHVDFYATVLGAAFFSAVVCDRIVERQAFCGDAVSAYALGLKIFGDLVGASGRL